jgi:hypothetical protein
VRSLDSVHSSQSENVARRASERSNPVEPKGKRAPPDVLANAKAVATSAFAAQAEIGRQCSVKFYYGDDLSHLRYREDLKVALLPFLEELAAALQLRVTGIYSGVDGLCPHFVVSLQADPTASCCAAKAAIEMVLATGIGRSAGELRRDLKDKIAEHADSETFEVALHYAEFRSSSSNRLLAARIAAVVVQVARANRLEYDGDVGHGRIKIKFRARPAYEGTVLRRDHGALERHLIDGRIRENGETWMEGERLYTCVNGTKERDLALESRYRKNRLARFLLGPFRGEG